MVGKLELAFSDVPRPLHVELEALFVLLQSYRRRWSAGDRRRAARELDTREVGFVRQRHRARWSAGDRTRAAREFDTRGAESGKHRHRVRGSAGDCGRAA